MGIQWVNDDFEVVVHRSGWKDTINSLKTHIQCADKLANVDLIIDVYLDTSFHWRKTTYKELGVIPYKKPWIGFMHHTTSGPNNSRDLLNDPDFKSSLPHCLCLVVLSEYLKTCLKPLVPNTIIHVLTHPTEIPSEKFRLQLYSTNRKKRLLHVGSWMRNVEKYLQVDTALVKTVLGGKQNFHQEYKASNPSVEFMSWLDNEDYDKILTENIVCIFLRDASAINTVIECIVRHTPIILNRLPALEELLGKDYPLFVDSHSQVTTVLKNSKLIQKGYIHLESMNKTKFTFDHFNKTFTKLLFFDHTDDCSICLEPLKVHTEVVITQCKHAFGQCIRRCGPRCPLCRQNAAPFECYLFPLTKIHPEAPAVLECKPTRTTNQSIATSTTSQGSRSRNVWICGRSLLE